MKKFNIHLQDKRLEDLKTRLKNTCWPEDSGNDNWQYGVNKTYLQFLVEFWINEYDWKKAEHTINAFPQYKEEINGVPIHFLYIKGKSESRNIPLLLIHGWPWTFWDMHKIIALLSHSNNEAAFDLIIPSLPGHGFSTPSITGMNFWKTADVFHILMTDLLGYEKYAASGGDWGALIASQLGHKYAGSSLGIHLMHTMSLNQFNAEKPWDVLTGHNTEAVSADIRKQSIARMKKFVSHYAVQMTDPQTLSYALQDSPVGLLAWLVERWRTWSETLNGNVESVFSKEHMITNAMLYWITGTVASSLRYYYDAAKYPWQPSHNREPLIEAPTGITFLGGENPIGISTEQRVEAFLTSTKAKSYNITYIKAHDKGGHFGYYENPEAIAQDIKGTFI